jgi:Ca2+-binding RTX toxin-like protein
VLTGGDGIDTLNAGTDADRLDGCAGNDTLNGDPGDDVLIGAPRGRLQCNMLTLHAAGSRNRRRAFSVRLVGDDLRLAEHPLFPRL